MKAAISATYVALLFTVLLLSWDNYKSALGQSQQQFQNYQNPTLGFSIQYPSDWQIEEEPGEQVTFVKEKDIVQFLVDVHNLDSPDITLAKYVQDEITNKREERQDFKLIESTPITISDGKAQAHKLVYTFLKEDDARAGETNKLQRIYTIEGDKVYSIAYLSEIDKFDDSLPLVEKMVDSFRLSDTGSGNSTTQVQSSDSSREDNDGSCDPSYPDVCIKSPPPNLNCPGVHYKNFKVIGSDPHGFDRDNDGIGCESTNGGGVPPPGKCDRVSYPDPDICIPPYPPDLNCPDISYKNFRVTGSDPHGFDGDNDGIGCDSANGGGVTPPDNGDRTPPDNGNRDCDPSYPDVCIKSPPPDLNCPDISYKNFRVTGGDPHGFDRDNDGFGCDSATEDTPTPTPTPTPEPEPCKEGFEPGAGGQCVPIPCYFGGDWPCPPCPEGVEGDRCADRDELLDFDCSDEGMETDPRCLNGDRHPCYPDPTVPECLALSPNPTPTPTANILQNEDPTLFGSPTSTLTPTTPTPPVDPSLLSRSQPQCEFGVNPETGLCNTEDIPSEPLPPAPEPLPPTPEPTPTPDEEFSTEEEPEEEVEEEPEEESADEPEGNGESSEDSTSE